MELLCLGMLTKLIFDVVSCIGTLTFFYQFCNKLGNNRENHLISNAFNIVQFAPELLILEC